jgi:Uncharacterised nucleotidyltransferase
MKPDVAQIGIAAALVEAILDPRTLAALDPRGWERMLSCARRNAVLAYLAERAVRARVIDDLPEIPRTALLSARVAAARLAQLARWEVDRVRRVLQPRGIPMIALKGVAYLLRELPHASTRLLSDVDIMVPRGELEAAEQALLAAGWQGTKLDPYDQQYYRKWSHELPPLRYPGRLLGVDVHHTICPPVSRLRPDAGQFWADSEERPDSAVRLLSPVDSVLHAAVHLFFDSDLDGRFRDLVDLHELLEAFGTDAAFWPALVARARQQGLGRPLYYGFETLSGVLRSPIPADARREARQFKPAPPVDRWMSRTLASVLTPADPARWPPAHRGRLWMLYVRSHWLRMPAHVLVPHLITKTYKKARGADPTRTAAA